jgi:hypothetical protein
MQPVFQVSQGHASKGMERAVLPFDRRDLDEAYCAPSAASEEGDLVFIVHWSYTYRVNVRSCAGDEARYHDGDMRHAVESTTFV